VRATRAVGCHTRSVIVDDEYAAIGRAMRSVISPADWTAAGPAARRDALNNAHDLLRSRTGLVADTRLQFVTDEEMAAAVGDPDAHEGLAFDETNGDILIPERHFADDNPATLLAGLAHETRHAWQRDVASGDIVHPDGGAAAEVIRNGFETYEPLAPRWKAAVHPLEVDAQDAGAAFGAGYEDS
jgi:hypothetical protein